MSNEVPVKPTVPLKNDDGKIIAGCVEDFSLALWAMAQVFHSGKKAGYERGSWAKVSPLRYKDAEWRHKLAKSWEENDKETELPHKWHEVWNVLAQLELELRKEFLDGADLPTDSIHPKRSI